MLGVGRDLCGSSSPTPLPKQGHLQQAAQDCVQAGLEYLQRRRLRNLPGQPVPVFCHPQSEEVLSHVLLQCKLACAAREDNVLFSLGHLEDYISGRCCKNIAELPQRNGKLWQV